MKNRKYSTSLIILIFLNINLLSGQDGIDKYFLGIELNGVLCGYSEVLVRDQEGSDDNNIFIDQKTYISFKALGNDITQKQSFTYLLDQDNGNFIYHDSNMAQGDQKMSSSMTVFGDTICIKTGETVEVLKIFLPDNTILPNTMFYPYLKLDFGIQGLESKTYKVFNVRNGKVQDLEYRKIKNEQLELNNKIYDAVSVNETDPNTGLQTKYWIDIESGLRLKMESQNNIKMYLADISLVSELKTGSWDDILFIKTNKKINDIRKISAIAVNACLEAIPGSDINDLNVPGQSFKGQISETTIKGVFEVNHRRYRGENAPIIGAANKFNQEISKFLKSEETIESGNKELSDLSLKIIEGSTDFWEAACRLSSWVAENIDGSIYGGSALETFKRGNGACGSQSLLLAAMCRAVGIPSRVVWGCLYTPEYGGSFGHHGWNEVYMGKEGWIPIDVTIHETDYIDSGHIRLGILETTITIINFKEMEILDYSLN